MATPAENPDDRSPEERRLEELLRNADVVPPDVPDEELTEDERLMRELQAKADAVRAPELPRLDAATEARLQALEQKAEAAQRKREAQKAQAERARESDGSSARGLGMGLSIAYTIIGVPILAWGIGYLIDLNRGTTVYRGIGALIGAVVGLAGAIFMLNRSERRPPQ